MATAQYVIRRALTALVQQGASSSFDAGEYSDGLDTLNDMMFMLEGEGVDLGFTEVTNVAHSLTIPRGSVKGVIDNLAVHLAPDYDLGIEKTANLERRAAVSSRAMRGLGWKLKDSELPSTLPKGSGNEDQWWYRPEFYQESSLDPDLLFRLKDNQIVTTIAASGTAVEVDGVWVAEAATQFEIDGSKVTYRGPNLTRVVTLSALIEPASSASQSVTLSLYANGSSVGSGSKTISYQTPAQIQFSVEVALTSGKYFQVYITNGTSTDNLQVHSASLVI